MEDYLQAESFDVPVEVITYLQSLVAAKPGIRLRELLTITKQYGLSPDSIYILLVTDGLYVDLSTCPLAEPDSVLVYFDQSAASMYAPAATSTFRPSSALAPIKPNDKVQWDDKMWEVLNLGQTHTWLRDQEGAVIRLDNTALQNLAGNNFIERLNGDIELQSTEAEFLKSLLAGAGPSDLAEANHRYKLLMAFQAGHKSADETVSKRTLFRWQAEYREAEARLGCGFAGLLPRISSRGNRKRKLPQGTITLTQEFIETEYEAPCQPTRHAIWSKLLKECKESGIIAPSYQTFCREVSNRPSHQQTAKRQGPRAAYRSEAFQLELNRKTPRHGDRPFEIGHIDHTELDIELVCSQTGENLGRPWLTILTDAYSRRILAFCLLFDPPSYRSCMQVLRECVRRHNRFPQTFVLDGALEFSCVYFETLLAIFKCTQKIRPASKARFGSVCERLFGSTNTRFIYNLSGNTQLVKKDVRLVTKEVNPKELAVWTLDALHGGLSEFAYEVYDTLSHPALGQSPREAFTLALARSGYRDHLYITYNEDFEMLTLPTTAKSKARVVPGKGVKINYIFYWNEAFRDPTLENTQVPVRYDPLNAGHAFAFVHKTWRRCVSAHNWGLNNRSERELMLASAELRRRNQQHGRRFTSTALRLAEFLKRTDLQEHSLLQLQRRRDAEVRRVLAKVERTQLQQTAIGEINQRACQPDALAPNQGAPGPSYSLSTDAGEDVDLSSLENYGEY